MRYVLLLLLLLLPIVAQAQSDTCADGNTLVLDTVNKRYKCITTGTLPSGSSTNMVVPNAAVTGTTVNRFAKLTGAPSTAVIAATTDAEGAMGIVVSGAGTTGSATIAILGQVSCAFDGATTAGNYVVTSATTAGMCHDAGSAFPTDRAAYGRVLTTNGGAGTYQVQLMTPDLAFQNGGNGKSRPGGSNFSVQYNSTNQFAGAGPGLAGQSLVSTGTGSAPTFQTIIPTNASYILADPDGGSGNWTKIGITATLDTQGSTTNVRDTDGKWNVYHSSFGGGTSGRVGSGTGYNLTRLYWNPAFQAFIKTDPTSVADSRYWVGIFSASPATSSTPSISYMGFRYDSSLDGTTWRCATDSGSGSPTVTNSGITVSAATAYQFRIEVSGENSVAFYINGTLVATHTTTLPATATDMGFEVTIRELSGAAGKDIYVNNIAVLQPRL